MSDSLWPHESQHTRPPCPSPSPRVHSNSRPSSRWCQPAISSSIVPFSYWPQSLPASGSFPMSQLFAWGGQSTGVSASASVLPLNTQDWSLLGCTSWIPFLGGYNSIHNRYQQYFFPRVENSITFLSRQRIRLMLFIIRVVVVYSLGELCPTLCDPMDYSWPDSSVHGIFQARTLEWVTISFSGVVILTSNQNTVLNNM